MENSNKWGKGEAINELQFNKIRGNIVNSVHYLLPFYYSIILSYENKVEYTIKKDDLIPPTNPVIPLADADEKEYILKLDFYGVSVGILTCMSSHELEFNLEKFNNFIKQSSKFSDKLCYTRLMPDGLIMTSFDQKTKYMNSMAKEMLKRLKLENEDVIYDFSRLKDQSILNPSSAESIIPIWRMNIGQYKLTEIMIPIIIKNETKGALIILSDNTVMQMAEDELLNKSAVIKEIHHRVKNNLQMISSLLRLQMRRVNSKIVEKAFKESINRISSIALIHEELSKEGLDQINLKNTVTSIMDMILSNLVPHKKNIKGIIEGPDIFIHADKATNISLCVTELIQNAVEHAFLFRKNGVITVRIQKGTGNNILVIVEDDGIGYNPNKNTSSLGLEIIEMITKETLKGSFKIEGHAYGTKNTIIFPNILGEEGAIS